MAFYKFYSFPITMTTIPCPVGYPVYLNTLVEFTKLCFIMKCMCLFNVQLRKHVKIFSHRKIRRYNKYLLIEHDFINV